MVTIKNKKPRGRKFQKGHLPPHEQAEQVAQRLSVMPTVPRGKKNRATDPNKEIGSVFQDAYDVVAELKRINEGIRSPVTSL